MNGIKNDFQIPVEIWAETLKVADLVEDRRGDDQDLLDGCFGG